ncbi:MAG: ABC transporter substrate-binding protein [Alphaproteobacteria bacterium]|nr:ABC transporter substrate-binding protein [Alphaproteobacteria bacterium]
MTRTITRRKLIHGAGATAATLALAPSIIRAAGAQERTVYVNTWGGSWTAAEEAAYFKPFTAKTGIRVRTVAPVSFAKLKAQVQSGQYEWDVSGLGIVEFSQAMHEGLLEPIDHSIIDRTQYPPQNINQFGVASVVLSTVLVYRKDKFPNGGPQSWADFWDVKKFPGNRCLYDRSFTTLAFALLADGVPADKLYPLDLDRAFKKLNEIKPHIKVWWTQGAQSQQLIQDGEVDMIAMWNARAQELIDRGAPLEIVWNGAENYTSFRFVAKGTPRAKLAWEYLKFASQPQQEAAFCSILPYGPANPKAFDYISPEVAAKMPSRPDRVKVAYQPDAEWLAPRLGQIRERFAQWLAS